MFYKLYVHLMYLLTHPNTLNHKVITCAGFVQHLTTCLFSGSVSMFVGILLVLS